MIGLYRTRLSCCYPLLEGVLFLLLLRPKMNHTVCKRVMIMLCIEINIDVDFLSSIETSDLRWSM